MSSGDIAAAQAMAPYSLRDMADDGLGLLTALGIAKAHVVGSSMGGMIAQTMAIAHPDRVLTLTSMMSSTGEPEYGRSTPAARQALFAPQPADREGYIAASEKQLTWSSRRYASADAIRELAARSYDRAYYPAGAGRQLGAMTLAGSRAEALRTLAVPTLVIHGLDDTLIDPSGGRRTAELVPGARLLLVPDMGHDRPRELWEDPLRRHRVAHPTSGMTIQRVPSPMRTSVTSNHGCSAIVAMIAKDFILTKDNYRINAKILRDNGILRDLGARSTSPTTSNERRRAKGHASRSIGQLMHRGPPRPRPSSLPGTVITSMPLSCR